MKKFLICLLFFLILFVVPMVNAGVNKENFEDGVLDSEWSAFGDYVIVEDITIENKYLHMHQGYGPGTINSEIGLWIFDECIYHCEADIYASSSTDQWVGLTLLWEGTDVPRQQVEILLHSISERFRAELYDFSGGPATAVVDLGPGNADSWHSLSITLHGAYVTIGINGVETDVFHGLYQKPVSLIENYAYVHGTTDDDVDYYTDNIKVFTKPCETLDGDNVEINPGQDAHLSDAQVDGNVQVTGGTATIDGSSIIAGNVECDGGMVTIENGSIVEGNLEAINGGRIHVFSSSVEGNVEAKDGSEIWINSSTINGDVITEDSYNATVWSTIFGSISSTNDGWVQIEHNSVNGNLQIVNPLFFCYENDNTVNGNNSGCP